jgi:peptide/nickel transport system substrate-binding protein
MPARHGLRIGVVALIALGSIACGASAATTPGPPTSSRSTYPGTGATGGATAASTTEPPSIEEHSYTPSLPAKPGGTTTVGGWEWPDTLLPYYAGRTSDLQLSSAMFDGLVKVTPNLRYLPNLVTYLPTLANGGVAYRGSGMDVTWNLKPEMEWSDGEPIVCDDIKATWQWVVDPANTVSTAGWRDVTGVDGGTGTRCVMHFGRVYEGYLTLVDPLLPAHYLSTVPVAEAKTKLYPLDNPAGGVYSGPYLPVSVETHASITFKPNPKYATIAGHAPYLDGLRWKFDGDVESMAADYLAGGMSFAQDMTESDLSSLADVPASQLVVRDSQTYEQLAFNQASFATKFGDAGPTVIRAIQMAVDRSAIVAGPLHGTVSVADDFVPVNAWYHRTYVSAAAFDVQAASALLANAGWSPGTDGFLARDGRPLAIDLCTTPRQARVETLATIADQLRQIGIRANVHPTAASTMFGAWDDSGAAPVCALTQGNYDVAEFSYVSTVDPATGYDTYVSYQTPEATAGHTGQNLTRVNDPDLDRAYETIIASVDPATIAQAMATVQRIYTSDQNTFELPLYFRKDVWLVSPKLHNFEGGSWPYGGTWNIGDWWLG